MNPTVTENTIKSKDKYSMDNLDKSFTKFDSDTKHEISIEYLQEIGLTTDELYSIGATAMDCSFMLTFQRKPEYFSEFWRWELEMPCDSSTRYNLNSPFLFSGHNQITIDSTDFLFKISVVDLDPKFSKKHFLKYRQNLEASYSSYVEYLKGEVETFLFKHIWMFF